MKKYKKGEEEKKREKVEEFKKGDFVRIATGKLGVVIGECGNQIMIRLNDLSYCTSFPSELEKIRGIFVPLDLSDEKLRRNLRGEWCQIRYKSEPESMLVEVPCCGFYKWESGVWMAVFEVGEYNRECFDGEELMKIATIDGLPVAAVEEIVEDEEKKADT